MIDAIILGLLKNKPLTGYDIKKIMEKEFGIFSSQQSTSIYYTLNKLEKNGLITKEELEEGHIKKYIYSLTNKGEKEFINLSKDLLLSNRRPFIDFDIPLYFLPYLNNRDLLARLRLRKIFLKKARLWLLDKLKNKDKFLMHQIFIFKHHLNLLKAEEKFLKEFIGFIKNKIYAPNFCKSKNV